jgi:hypothetical protein
VEDKELPKKGKRKPSVTMSAYNGSCALQSPEGINMVLFFLGKNLVRLLREMLHIRKKTARSDFDLVGLAAFFSRSSACLNGKQPRNFLLQNDLPTSLRIALEPV